MADFKVNIDVLGSTITVYQTAIDDLETAVSDAQDAIDLLKSSGWQSGAGDAFFANFDDEWKDGIEKRILVLKHLKECLDIAETEYSGLVEDAVKIGNAM